ncbi:MAG TPA: hypothetical protein VN757_11575 [Steroidobacteraceae bacterium]|nr:hypothetical protein [Steroidobacteraceae bacterium]
MALHLQGFRGVRFNFVKHLGGEYTARLTDLDGDVQHPVVPGGTSTVTALPATLTGR